MSRKRASGGGRSEEEIQFDATEEVEFTVTKDVAVKPTFEAMGLREELLRGALAWRHFLKDSGGVVLVLIMGGSGDGRERR